MKRVVVTGLGVVSSIGNSIQMFRENLFRQKSGITIDEELVSLNFGCQVSGRPEISETIMREYFEELTLRFLTSKGIVFGYIAGIDAWKDAGLPFLSKEEPGFENAGCVFGSGLSGAVPWREAIYKVDKGLVRELGSRVVEQTMPSGISAYLSGKLGLENWISSNASACATGTESFILAAEHIRQGKADIMLAGSCENDGPYIWGGFDGMRVLNRKMNETPGKASRPMAQDVYGFVPGAGAGAFVLESLEHALARNATIYGEYAGGYMNSGGQRRGGSMTAPTPSGVQSCLHKALENASVTPAEIDLVSGHLTSTMGDVHEVRNLASVFGRETAQLPYLNTLKSLIGHCLSAAGSIELVSVFLQLMEQKIHGNSNIETLHEEIIHLWNQEKIPSKTIDAPINYILKANFGFGDVNAVAIIKKFDH